MENAKRHIGEVMPFIGELEGELALPEGFLEALLDEDDWSFVIKLHALLEAVITHLLVEALDEAELADIFSRLEMSNLTTGKLAFVKKLDLLDSDSRRYIQKLSELRNAFVHDIANASVSLDSYLSSIDESERKGFHKAFRWGYKDDSEIEVRTDDGMYDLIKVIKVMAIGLLKYSPKISIWLGSIVILGQGYFQVETKRLVREMKVVTEQLMDTLVRQNSGPNIG